MFSGIISATGRVKRIRRDRQGLRLIVATPKGWRVKVGQSIAVNGVCSTVIGTRPDLQFQYMPETLKRTNLSTLIAGSVVNLEQPLALGDQISGNFVHGLVDTVGTIASVARAGNSHVLTITVKAKKLLNLVAAKTPVTVEGISLTVVDVNKNFFTHAPVPPAAGRMRGSAPQNHVSRETTAVRPWSFTTHVIPYTWQHTNLNEKRIGDGVNLEFDLVAKYLQRFFEHRST
ncbi:MAG: riboflavin synthase [Candidatus Kerfeldbacteria bacterium]|nr:riboflavin synthase [Candidatus Kerfeldbacteria bacterium]